MDKIITCFLIRHGKTPGNLEKRYIGSRSDESLSEEGVAELEKLSSEYIRLISHIEDEMTYLSGAMKRCRESMEVLFKSEDYQVIPDLTEIDFGDFEGHNYSELSGNEDYQRWIDSGGELSFPNGDSPQDFRKRCISAFESMVSRYKKVGSAAFIVHGGTIMSILEKYAVPHRDYFDWHCENGHGYICKWDGERITDTEKI